jgi:hypothetical protein
MGTSMGQITGAANNPNMREMMLVTPCKLVNKGAREHDSSLSSLYEQQMNEHKGTQ